MKELETAKKILKGCGKKMEDTISEFKCGYYEGLLCRECKATLKAKYECWKNEVFGK